jgi:hypothetical protein
MVSKIEELKLKFEEEAEKMKQLDKGTVILYFH